MGELRSENRGAVRVLTIDGEARMNVLSPGLVAELADAARAAAAEESVRAVVITGAGSRAFCAGVPRCAYQSLFPGILRAWFDRRNGRRNF